MGFLRFLPALLCAQAIACPTRVALEPLAPWVEIPQLPPTAVKECDGTIRFTGGVRLFAPYAPKVFELPKGYCAAQPVTVEIFVQTESPKEDLGKISVASCVVTLSATAKYAVLGRLSYKAQ